jgi:hypothetical protein
VDPVMASAALGQLDSWRQEALAAAKNKRARTAANWLYAGSLALATAEQLRMWSVELLAEIHALTPDDEERTRVLGRVRELANSQDLIGRLSECLGMLREADADRAGSVRRTILGLKDDEVRAGSITWIHDLAELTATVLDWVGVGRDSPMTPVGIMELELALRDTDDPQAIDNAQLYARDALNRIDGLQLLKGRYVLGRLRTSVATDFGLPEPPRVA